MPSRGQSLIQRMAKFALVGAVGIAVQLAVLEGLTRLGCHYLPATGFAVETAVLHNFLWHQRFTWSDRINVSVRWWPSGQRCKWESCSGCGHQR